MKSRKCLKTFALVLGTTLITTSAIAEAWKFGVMSDTQWPNSPDGKNPNVAVNIINHINQQFIQHGVKFVIQVGDLTDKPSLANTTLRVENLDTRAVYAQALYDAGIGFYPLRGNHEDKPSSQTGSNTGAYAREMQRVFPQTLAGMNNITPRDAFDASNAYIASGVNYPVYYSARPYPVSPHFQVGTHFATEPSMEGLTYSFDYQNARFVLIDQFTKPDGTSHANLDSTDVNWIGNQFASRPAYTHAFSFGHKGLVTENHADNLFNSTNPTASQPSKDLMESFMKKLQESGVRYHIGGHDHMHNRALISSPNTGSYHVQNIIAASNSYKFYIPPKQSTFLTQSAFRSLETPLSQELFTVGYYIFTVDGPRVVADYYAMPNGCGGDCDETYDVIPYAGNTPTQNGLYQTPVPFVVHETFGYSLNGKEVLVAQGASYALTDDTSVAIANGEIGYLGTTAKILDGTNGSTAQDFNLRPLTKAVDTGWTPAADGLASDIFTLWGMQDSLATQLTANADGTASNYSYVDPNLRTTDTYVLSLSYHDPRVHGKHLGNAGYRLVTRDDKGGWVNAVEKNAGGKAQFVPGPWAPGYALGTYGVDQATGTAWAVVNHGGDFAVARGADGNQD